MAYELRDMGGTMFKNKRKEKENQPDMTGDVKINGEVYWVSAWKKSDKNGDTFYSFGFKKKDFSEAKEAVRDTKPSVPEDFSDDIPFAPVRDWL